MIKLLSKLFMYKIKVVSLSEDDNKRILAEIKQIGGIDKFLELHKQAGYELYGKTKDERWLGYVSFAESLIVALDNITKPVEEDVYDDGYEATTG